MTYYENVGLVIDNLEGGYFNQLMFTDGRLSTAYEYIYKNSGETFFGIDRLAGGAINLTAAGFKFWGLIDAADAKNKWAWNYRGGTLGPQLKQLAGEMIYTDYVKYSKLYLSEKAQKIVNDSSKLTFNFIYATWNGPGWFQYFAKIINEAIEKGTVKEEELVKIAVDTRKNSTVSLISQGGSKIEKLFNTLSDFVKKNVAGIALTCILSLTAILATIRIVKMKNQ